MTQTTIAPAAPPEPRRLNRRRYLRIVFFFGRIALQVIGWYLIVQPIFGRGLVRRGEAARMRRWARQFRLLAIRMGGVMIKLGQFVSSRVDVLPPEIIGELAGLQDEVPAEPFTRLEPALRAALGTDWRSRFAEFDESTVAAASFGQAYRARLKGEGETPGEHIVTKVQRPGIEDIVHTDLSALDVVARLAMRFRFIRRRANVLLLLEEFARVLWEELDYTKEAANAERFAELFKDDMGVYIPAVYRDLSTRNVLTLEDVTAIKLSDYAALEAAGIDRGAVAQRLLDCYMTQVFVHRFFHADPHPGNIFIYPLPEGANQPKPAQNRPGQGRPFYLVFIDFGMTGELTPEVAAGLREAVLGVITRDTPRLVRSFGQLGFLLPDADSRRIEEACEAVFNQIWGLNMTELMGMDYAVMRDISRQFSDLLFDLPFQVPQNLIYLGRAISILSGMCTGLDPQFDPWKAIQPFARSLLDRDGGGDAPTRDWSSLINWENLRALLTPETVSLALTTGQQALTRAATLPARAEAVLGKLDGGELQIEVRPDERFETHLRRLELAGSRIVLALVFGSLTLSATLLTISNMQTLGLIGYGLAGISLLSLLLRGGGE
jgi:predicted unusual protein kinase regulating ubiquinone biosynthesis (AarF/ABC1/UbiB family)